MSGKEDFSLPLKNSNPGRRLNIALLGDELNYEIPITIFNTINELARQHNYNLLYIAGEAFNTPFEYAAQSNILYNLLASQAVSGLITMSNLLCAYTSPREFSRKYLESFSIPIVSLGMLFEGKPSVILDNATGMYEAVSHLIEDHHFSRIAFLSGTPEHPDVAERFSAFTRAMECHNLPVEDSLLLQGNFQRQSGEEAVRELLDTRGKKIGVDVQAIVCCNDYMAVGVLLELQARGIQIPEDIALVGFDALHLDECLTPSLSTVSQSFDIMAANAFELLHKMLEGKAVPEIVHIPSRFVSHHSCGCADKMPQSDLSIMPGTKQKLRQTSPRSFRELINNPIFYSDIYTLINWKQALYYLRINRKSQEQMKNGDGISNQWVWNMLDETAYNTFYSVSYIHTFYNTVIDMASDLELSELLTVLPGMLPGMGIKKCFICLYGDNKDSTVPISPMSRLILAVNPDNPVELPPEGLPFPTAHFLPKEIMSKQEGSLVVMALYYQKEQFGYMLVDSGVAYKYIFKILRKQISSVLKGNQLLKDTRIAYNLLNVANEQKTRFFINLAHETKTPLTIIRNYLDLYMKQHPPDDSLLVIKQNLDSLVANMLYFMDVEKLQRGLINFRHDLQVDLSASAEKKCALFSEVAKMKEIRLSVNIEKDIIVGIDPYALDRILNNLLDNALKYIQEEGKVWIKVYRRKGHAVLQISDNGPGFSVDTYEHIFEPFYPLSLKKSGQHGVGVGLSIVKKMVDEFSASISAKQSRSGGACFTITFKESKNICRQEPVQEILATNPLPAVRGIIKEKNISPDKLSILVVDDNIHLLQFIQTALGESYSIYPARSVQEARFKLRTIPRPSLIISDIMMDNSDGFSFLQELSETEEYNDIPFIFLTALAGEDARQRGLDLGAVDYIEKPFSINELAAKINSIIALRLRQEKKEIACFRNKMEEVLAGMGTGIASSEPPGFDTLCKKYKLNNREQQILRLLMNGMAHKIIGAELNISLRSVAYHLAKVYKKCGVNNKYELLDKLLT